jgi:hypothetical protein
MSTGGVTTCANHPAERALARCRQCRDVLCDRCCVFTINDDVWCEACGSGVEEDARPNYARGGIVLAIGVGLTTAVVVLKIAFVSARIPYFMHLMFLGYAGSIFWAWNTVSPVLGVDRPTVRRRMPGTPLPRNASRV